MNLRNYVVAISVVALATVKHAATVAAQTAGCGFVVVGSCPNCEPGQGNCGCVPPPMGGGDCWCDAAFKNTCYQNNFWASLDPDGMELSDDGPVVLCRVWYDCRTVTGACGTYTGNGCKLSTNPASVCGFHFPHYVYRATIQEGAFCEE